MFASSAAASAILDRAHLAALTAQVAETVHDPRRRSRLLDKLVARDALTAILDADNDTDQTGFEINVRGGFAGDDRRREMLGIIDVMVNGYLVGIYPAPGTRQDLRFGPGHVDAQAAPDVWVVITVRKHSAGVQAEVLGWRNTADLRRLQLDADGTRMLPVTDLEPPQTLSAYLRQPIPPRTLTVEPDVATLQALRATLGLAAPVDQTPGDGVVEGTFALQPLSRTRAAVFDCLVADPALAEAYVAALARDPTARVRVAAPAAVALPERRIVQEALAAVREGDFARALAKLRDAAEPDLLHLRAVVYSLQGNLRAAIDDARRATQLAPESYTLLGRLQRPQFALAWQHPPAAAMAATQVEVIDVDDPDREPPCQKETPQVRLVNDGLVFSLGVQLPPQYAGRRYRLFVVDQEVRDRLRLTDDSAFRQVFSRRLSQPHSDAGALAQLSPVATEEGGLLEGAVALDGLIDIWKRVQGVSLEPEDFFTGKTVAVVLY